MKKFQESISLYKIEIVWVLLFSINALLGSMLTISTQVDLDSLSTYRLILAIAAMFFTWTNTMMALMKTMGKNVAKGKQLIFGDESDTQFFQRPNAGIENPKQNENKPITQPFPKP